MKKKKKNILVLILFTIIVILLLLFYALYYRGYIVFNFEKKETISKEKITKDTNKEKVITDSNMIFSIRNKVDYLNINKLYMRHIISNLYKEEKITYISHKNKLNIVLESLNNNFTNITTTKPDIENSIGSYYANKVFIENKQISISEVKKRYFDLFGVEVNEFIHIEGANSYIYDNINQVYYYVYSYTKGNGIFKEYDYDIKYTMDDEYVYLYKAIGYSDFSKETTSDTIKYNLYSSYSNEIYKENISEEELSNFTINSSNYNYFSKYKYKFKKQNDNYYFVSVEKIK